MEREDLWNLTYLSWRSFREAVLRGKGDLWDGLVESDLVIGGMDFAMDFLYCTPCCSFTNQSLIFPSSPAAGYETLPLECCRLYSNMKTLSEKTTVWPHPEELFISGNKIQGYETLRMASLSMNLSVPLYVIVDDQLDSKTFQDKVRRGLLKGALKRDYSMRGDHVITPKMEDPLGKLKHAIQEERKTWPIVLEFFGKPRWFIQPFLAQLLQIGEARVVIVGGRIVYKMCTTLRQGVAKEWECTDKPVLRPLHKHR